MEFKYIIIDKIMPVLFSHGIEHVEEANGRNVTSAGFVRINVRRDGALIVDCFGSSVSLNIDGSERDAKIIHAVAVNNMGLGG